MQYLSIVIFNVIDTNIYKCERHWLPQSAHLGPIIIQELDLPHLVAACIPRHAPIGIVKLIDRATEIQTHPRAAAKVGHCHMVAAGAVEAHGLPGNKGVERSPVPSARRGLGPQGGGFVHARQRQPKVHLCG